MGAFISHIAESSIEALAVDYLKQSEGKWKSQRRYYKLANYDEPQEIVSSILVKFLETGNPELQKLAKLHHFDDNMAFICGTEITWESEYTKEVRKPSKGKTLFGLLGDILYRDRGFATPDPVTAKLQFPNPNTMCLKTEYAGSAFEEEIKLIGQNFRTRQTIISRAGEEQIIGQYLEKRIG
jgi:CpeS-like protein